MARCSVGFIRFLYKELMWQFIAARRGLARPVCAGRELWYTVEKTPEERQRSRLVTAARQALAGALQRQAEIEACYRRGVLWLGDSRLAEYSATAQRWLVHAQGLEEATRAGVLACSQDQLVRLLNASVPSAASTSTS